VSGINPRVVGDQAKRRDIDACCAGALQNASAGVGGGACGDHIIDKQDVMAMDAVGRFRWNRERALQILTALIARQADLGGGVAVAL
jgi:hypothetical protein